MNAAKAFLNEAGCVEAKNRRGRQPWKPRNLLPLYLDVGSDLSERALYKMESVTGSLTEEEAAKAARKMLTQHGTSYNPTAVNDVTATIMLHSDLLHHTPGPAVVSLLVRAILPGNALLYQDRLWWDINSPHIAIDQYTAAVCADLRLNMVCYQDVTMGRLQPSEGPDPGLQSEQGTQYPNVVAISPELKAAIRQRQQAAAAGAAPASQAEALEAAAGLSPQLPAAAALSPAAAALAAAAAAAAVAASPGGDELVAPDDSDESMSDMPELPL
eukprot:scaffold2.g7461.t1